jgi:hypothetical protein
VKEWSRIRATLAPMAAVVMLLAAGSCADEEATAPCPVYDVAAFEGRVLAGGIGIEAEVGARAAVGPTSYDISFVTRSDSTGHYRLPVAAGSYWLQVDPDPYTRSGPGDTLTVQTGIRSVDILCARVELRVEVPSAMEGRELQAVLKCPGTLSSFASATVRDGRLEYVFQPVQADEGKIAFTPERSWPSRYWYPGTADSDSAQSITFRKDQPTVIDARLDRWAEITGSLDGPGLEYSLVEAYTAADSIRVASVRTTDGSFVLDVFSAGPVKVRVESSDVEQWIGGNTFASAQVFELHPGDVVRDVTVTAGGIRCTLEGPRNLIYQLASLTLRDESGRNCGPTFGSYSPITVGNLRAGRYRMYVSGIGGGQGWGSQWYDGATSLAQATPIDVREGELTAVMVHLSPGGVIEGRLLQADGTPVEYGPVTITDADGAASTWYWIQYRDLGVFRFDGVGDGRYRLAAELEGGTWWFPGTANPDSAGIVEMMDHATVSGIEWRLP